MTREDISVLDEFWCRVMFEECYSAKMVSLSTCMIGVQVICAVEG